MRFWSSAPNSKVLVPISSVPGAADDHISTLRFAFPFHPGSVSDNAKRNETIQIISPQPQHLPENLLVVSPQRRRRSGDGNRTRAATIRRRRKWLAPDGGPVEPLPEAPRGEVGIVEKQCQVVRRGRGDAGILQLCHQGTGIALGGPGSDGVIKGVYPLQAVARVVEPVQPPGSFPLERLPLILLARLNQNPLIFAAARIDPVSRIERRAIARPRRRVSRGYVVNDSVYGEGEKRLRLRQVDELTLARMRKKINRNQQRRRAVQSAYRIPIGDVVRGRRILGIIVQVRQPRCLLDGGPVGA